MNLHDHANAAAELAGLPMDIDSVSEFGALAPITATPAAVAGGAAVGAALVGAAAGGAAIGEAID